MIDYKLHPFAVLQYLKTNIKANLIFEYSIYTSGPPGITLSRQIMHIDSARVCQAWLQDELNNLSEGEELAWHSKVLYSGRVFHIPMADFMGELDYHNVYNKLLASRYITKNELFIYDSGRSFHAYIGSLIEETEWHSYLGSLLLLNPSGTAVNHTVDCRWVGHSLENGFSALRWSSNTSRHKKYPILVDDCYK